jgi:integrase
MCYTGMRLGEIVGLDWSSVGEKEIEVRRSVVRRALGPTKTGRMRYVPIVPRVRAILDAQREFLKGHPGASSGLVFPAEPSHAEASARRFDREVAWYRAASTFRYALNAAIEYAGLPDISIHSLRRSASDLLRVSGVPDLVIQSMMGWTTSRMQGLYSTVRTEERTDALLSAHRAMESLAKTPPDEPSPPMHHLRLVRGKRREQ